jgi:hypothetical protein
VGNELTGRGGKGKTQAAVTYNARVVILPVEKWKRRAGI